MRSVPAIKWSFPASVTVMLALALLVSAPASGQTIYQRVPFASAPNPVGSGGRAVGWAGAYIAVADDATAASWNPAGLVQLIRPESSIVLSYHSRLETIGFEGLAASSEDRSNSTANLNYLSVVYPFNLNNLNLVASLNYQRLYEFDRDLTYTVSGLLDAATSFAEVRGISQVGALTTLTPAFAVQILPQWSMGVAVNLWGLDPNGDGWKQQWQVTRTHFMPSVPGGVGLQGWSQNREEYKLSGHNFTIGTHVKIDNLTIGAVYKTSWKADVDFKSTIESATFNFKNPAANTRYAITQKEQETLTWPESYGVGLAYRYSDAFTVAFDLYTTRWSRYQLEKNGVKLNLLAGNDQTADIKDTWQARAGAEYLFILPRVALAVRGGFFYDPEPLADQVNEFYGTSIGCGVVYQNLVLDAAIQYRWGNDVKGEMIENVRSNSDVKDVFAIISIIYYL